MKTYCFLNGEILPTNEARVSVSDIGLMRGFGLYEAFAVFGGRPLRLTDHWQRLEKGAEVLGLKVPVSAEEAEKIIRELCDKSGLTGRAPAKVILTGGKTLSSIDYDKSRPTFYILVEEWLALPKELYEQGAKLITEEYKRELPEVKTINYITAVSLQAKKKKEGAIDILYIYGGKIYECATSNIFLVKSGTLITPDKDVLEGVTRKIVLELAKSVYKIEKREVAASELESADEVFITASFKDIVPVVKIDNFKIGKGTVGVITKDLMGRFTKYLS